MDDGKPDKFDNLGLEGQKCGGQIRISLGAKRYHNGVLLNNQEDIWWPNYFYNLRVFLVEVFSLYCN